jgi:hypothetical protein
VVHDQLQSALVRRDINAGLLPPYPSIVPLQTLMYDMANYILKFQRPPGDVHSRKRARYSTASVTDGTLFEFASRIRTARSSYSGDLLGLPPMSLLRLLHDELTKAVSACTQRAKDVQAAGIRTEGEPEFMNVSSCQNPRCHAELFDLYVACRTCEDRVCSESGVFLAIAPGRTDLAAQFRDDTPIAYRPGI